jgi:acetyl/propionyl-CoA carboxylase alpha subunit
MRDVHRFEDLADLIRVARREAQAAFGDDRVYLEKLIVNGRHIEIQILGDKHGNIIHLGERECSLQRRHQKLVEESPSPIVDEKMRQEMGETAVRAAQSVDYHSAGTVEFIVDQNKNYYFLEMNTRLQVEHPVTELVTGVDVVREMLNVADGRKLRYRQAYIWPKGWAIECRILAENPRMGFIPSTGQIRGLTLPTGPGVRVDTGIYYGSEITPYYDSMIAKLIVWDESRDEAIIRMRRALEEFQIVGVSTTIPVHIQLMEHPNFKSGDFHTRWLETEFVFNQTPDPVHLRFAAVAATLLAHRRNQRAVLLHEAGDSPWRLYGRREALDRRLK